MMNGLIVCLIISAMLSSCDIAHYIIVRNRTKHDIDMTWSKDIPAPFRLDSPQPLFLKADENWQEFYGFGKWTREDELSLKEILKESELNIGGEEVTLESRTILKRKGVFNNEMNITIK